jgi:hypothetical protein
MRTWHANNKQKRAAKDNENRKSTRNCRRCNSEQPLHAFPLERGHICNTCHAQAAGGSALSEYFEKYNRVRSRHSTNYAMWLKDPEFKIAHALRRRTLKLLQGIIRAGRSSEFLGCTLARFKLWLEFNFSEGMTHGSMWHIDHVIPCCQFDLTDPEQQKKCFHWTNMKPMLARENWSKSGRLVEDEIPHQIARLAEFKAAFPDD